MRIWNEYISIQSKNKRDIIDLTAKINQALAKAEITDGIVVVSSMHSNGGVFISQEEELLHRDLLEWLETVAPEREGYHFTKGESNAGAYLKGMVVGHQATLPIENGKAVLGPWQKVFFAELDGGRPKRVMVKIIGE